MTDCVNNISDHVISSLIPKIGINYVTGADTAVLTPFVNSGNPMSCTSISFLTPYQDIPYSGTDCRINGTIHHAAPGECLICPVDSRRWFFHNDAAHRSVWVHLDIRLEPDFQLISLFDVPHVIRGEAANRCRILMDRLNRGRKNILRHNRLETVSERRAGGLPEQLEDHALCLLLLKEILALSTPREALFLAVNGFQELEPAIRFIQKHKLEKVRLDELAHCCHCSRSAFEKKFRRVFGISPGKYLLNLRLSEAEHLLRDTDATCMQIAEKSGFANPFVFSRLFRNRYGLPPSRYRHRDIFC